MYRQGRVFFVRRSGHHASRGCVRSGLADGGVLATMKHFPGSGSPAADTDRSAGVIRASRATLGSTPTLSTRHRSQHPLIMLSNASYTAYDPDAAAGWSRAIALVPAPRRARLRGREHHRFARWHGPRPRRVRGRPRGPAARAGTDMTSLTGSERTTDRIFHRLLRQARDRDLDRSELIASWQRILRIKDRLPS